MTYITRVFTGVDASDSTQQGGFFMWAPAQNDAHVQPTEIRDVTTVGRLCTFIHALWE